MKVLLINPLAQYTIVGNNPSIIEEERGYNPPLGLLYLASSTLRNTSHQIEVIDAQVEELTYEELRERIANQKPDVVGITAMTLTLVDVLKTARLVKEISKRIRVVLGGPQVNIYPEETIRHEEVDFLVLGEGELTFSLLLDNLENIRKLKEIKGILFKHEGEIVATGNPEFISELDSLPFPLRTLTPYWRYTSLLAKRSPITTMITSRGCPYKCVFCDRPHLGRKFRARSAENVVDEIEECVNMGIKEILIYDDTFTVSRRRVIDICDEIISRKLDIVWDVRARVDNVDREMLRKMRQAGCERIHYGVEAGTEKILKVLKKGITLEDAKRAFRTTKEVGMSTLAYFMIGSPEEKREEILKTLEFARELNPDFVHITITTPFPGTELYRMGLKKGIIRDFWREFSKDPDPDFPVQYWEEYLSGEELQKLLRYAYKSFYLRPRYILKEMLTIRSLDEFGRKVKAGLKVVGL
ncbi:MAG TPA: radical SAM protein [Candidatus Omnitrophica bacterium]|nr:radical SAM protein [Candidatus Omnitrophota bacterium]